MFSVKDLHGTEHFPGPVKVLYLEINVFSKLLRMNITKREKLSIVSRSEMTNLTRGSVPPQDKITILWRQTIIV